MTAATLPAKKGAPLAQRMQRKSKVGFGDLLWLTFRQHRSALIFTTAFYAVFALLLMASSGSISIGNWWRFDPSIMVPACAGIVAVFWGAPLLAGEYEQHTNMVAWSQDVSPARWLLAKVGLLGATVVVLSTALDLALNWDIAKQLQHDPNSWNFGAYTSTAYEAWLPLAIAYAVFGFVLGVAAGAVFRRTMTSAAVTLFGFAGVRLLMSLLVRPALLANLVTPVRLVSPVSAQGTAMLNGPSAPGNNDYIVQYFLQLNSAGQVVPDSATYTCGGSNGTEADYVNCLHRAGVVNIEQDFQPQSRLHLFQSAELGIYVVLIAVLIAVAFWTIRRHRSA